VLGISINNSNTAKLFGVSKSITSDLVNSLPS